MLVEAKGVPLALEVGPANRHEVKMLAATLDGIVVERPEPSEQARQNLCLDKGYAGEPTKQAGQARGYEVHIPDKVNGKQKRKRKGGRRKARRWVVERTLSWFGQSRRLSKDYEYWPESSEAMAYVTMTRLMLRRLARL